MTFSSSIMFFVTSQVLSQCCGGVTATQTSQGNRLTVFGDLSDYIGSNDLCGQQFLETAAVVKNNCCKSSNPLFFYPDFSSNIYCKTGVPGATLKNDCHRLEGESQFTACNRSHRRYDRSRYSPCNPTRTHSGYGYDHSHNGSGYNPVTPGCFIGEVVNASTLEEIVNLYWKRQNFYKCAAVTNNTLKQAEKCLVKKKTAFVPANVTCVEFAGPPLACNFTVNAFNAYKTINFTLSPTALTDPACSCEILVDTPDVLTLQLGSNGPVDYNFTFNFLCPDENGTTNGTLPTFFNSGNFFGAGTNGLFGARSPNLLGNTSGFSVAQSYNNVPITNSSPAAATITPTVTQSTTQADPVPPVV